MSTVEIYVYDLSKGVAKTLSFRLIGKDLDGIWHTAVVVFGKEFFFGGCGIVNSKPCGTVLGQPDTILKHGKTQVPEKLFMNFLFELSKKEFRPETYHLFNHNCNTFTDKAAFFLTSKHIPDYILKLPKQVAETPLGNVIKNVVDQMSIKGSPLQELCQGPSKSRSLPERGAEAKKDKNNSFKYYLVDNSDLVLFDKELSSRHQHLQAINASANVDKSLIIDLCDYAADEGENSCQLRAAHVILLNHMLQEADDIQLLVLDLYRVILTKSSRVAVKMLEEFHFNWQQFLIKVCDPEFKTTVKFYNSFMRLVSNWIYQLAVAERYLPDTDTSLLLKFNARMLTDHPDCSPVATQLSYNLTCIAGTRNNNTIDLASALLNLVICSGDSTHKEIEAHDFAVKALRNLSDMNEIVQFVAKKGLDCDLFDDKNKQCLQDLLRNDKLE